LAFHSTDRTAYITHSWRSCVFIPKVASVGPAGALRTAFGRTLSCASRSRTPWSITRSPSFCRLPPRDDLRQSDWHDYTFPDCVCLDGGRSPTGFVATPDMEGPISWQTVRDKTGALVSINTYFMAPRQPADPIPIEAGTSSVEPSYVKIFCYVLRLSMADYEKELPCCPQPHRIGRHAPGSKSIVVSRPNLRTCRRPWTTRSAPRNPSRHPSRRSYPAMEPATNSFATPNAAREYRARRANVPSPRSTQSSHGFGRTPSSSLDAAGLRYQVLDTSGRVREWLREPAPTVGWPAVFDSRRHPHRHGTGRVDLALERRGSLVVADRGLALGCRTVPLALQIDHRPRPART